MKKLLILILIILAGFGAYTLYQKFKPQVAENAPQASEPQPDPSSGTFTFDGETVTLSKGVSSTRNEISQVLETKMLEERAYGDLNKDEKNDTVLLVAQSGGGSGIFIYAAAYISGPVSYKGSNAVFLGDRVSPQSVSISNGVVTIKYLDREEGEPLAADPTVPTVKQLVFQNGELVEK